MHMWMRHSFAESSWWKAQMTRLNEDMQFALSYESQEPIMKSFWHVTRVLEYPWALQFSHPSGLVLDVGSNAQFHVALARRGIQVIAHYTPEDYDQIGMMNCMGQGWEPLAPIYRKIGQNVPWIVGLPGAIPLLPNSFDTIYCLSVLEHVEPDNVETWLKWMWSLLRPGGQLCLTVDFFVDVDKGHGSVGHWNHDLRFPLFPDSQLELGVLSEIPWSEHFDGLRLHNDSDIHMTQWPDFGKLAVFGLILRKRHDGTR